MSARSLTVTIKSISCGSRRIIRQCLPQTRIDDRERTDEALRQSKSLLADAKQELQATLDSIPTLAWRTRPDGFAEYLNKRWLDYTGMALDHALGWGWKPAIHPEDLPKLHMPGEVEARMRRFDGEYRWFLFRSAPVRNKTGRIVAWYGTNNDIEDRKRAEAAVAASERNLDLIINTMPALAWSARPDGSAEFFNRHYVDYVGLSAAQLQDWGWTAAVHPDDLDGLTNRWQAIMASRIAGEAEARLRRFDGEYRWFLMRANPLRDKSGNIVKWFGVDTDIEDRKRAEKALQVRELELRQMTETIPEMLWSATPEGTVDYCNARVLSYTGFAAEEVMGAGCMKVLHPDDVDATLREWNTCVSTGSPYRVELRIFNAAERIYRWCVNSARPMLDPQGRILKWHGTIVDVQDLKQVQERLQQSEAFLAQAQRLSLTGSFFWRVDNDDIRFSAELYRLFEFEQDSPLTIERIATRVHPEDIPLLREKIERARNDKGGLDYEIRLQMTDGRVKYCSTMARSCRRQDGGLEYYGAIQDITARRLSEEALTDLRSELGRMARITSLGALTASVAHEVSQPLSGIITNANTCLRMLGANPPNVEGARETARRTIRDGNRASQVVTRLRALFSKKKPTFEPVDLNEATREVIALFVNALQTNRVVLRTELADDVPAVLGDRVQLQQVILNLVQNAIDAMATVNDRPRELLIRTERDQGDCVRLAAQDAGVGFDAKAMQRLFESFYTTKSSGMGIGLSISRSIIESHHGRLWAKTNEGPGATFYFSIPAQSDGIGARENASARMAS
jgi:PAS domain S-box-containing protein